ncbi:MAG: type I methionyl aminopeptidase [Bacteroidetes bacterium]|jgi:methionyl aminopeptidase|nr:type I methionyl aminopeptidase [Bacteroidota bacterium]MCL5034015.1 type I methionyl aminopeptidase [Bacteroidota bacterium]
MISVKTPREVELMREVGAVVAGILDTVEKAIKPGVTTKELDEIAEDYVLSQGAKPAFKGYGFDRKNLFPATVCLSLDDQVVHGIPGPRKIEEGQLVSVDVGAIKNGYYGDAAKTFAVGTVTDEKKKLMEVTEKALYIGIENAVGGNHVEDISQAVQDYVEENGFSVVRDLVGHGIGTKLHEDPPVPNYGKRGRGPLLRNGMTIAIEPMVNAGSYRVYTARDGWTVYTSDGKPSAHFEHTVVITDGKPEILTLSNG